MFTDESHSGDILSSEIQPAGQAGKSQIKTFALSKASEDHDPLQERACIQQTAPQNNGEY